MWHKIFVIFSLAAILLSINQIFRLQIFGFFPMDISYLYYLMALYLSLAFIMYPTKQSGDRVVWYDVALFVLTIVVTVYLGIHGLESIQRGWEWSAPPLATAFSVILWALVLEAVRRSSGWILFTICLAFSLYPLFAGYLPGVLQGQQYDFLGTARMHVMSVNSILGVPLQTIGNLLIGFMLFGVVLGATGGGEFFINLANALLGHAQGRAGKGKCCRQCLFWQLKW